jgi:multiple sugar transport system permease protein
MSGYRQIDGLAVTRHFLLGIGAALFLAPFLWMIGTSFKSRSEIFDASLNPFPAGGATLDNYRHVLLETPMPQFLVNGVVVCSGILVAQLVIAIPAAYALAKLKFPGQSWFFSLVLVGLAIPAFLPTLPLFVALHKVGLIGSRVGLLNTYAALILPFSISVFGIFLFRQHFKAISDDTIHAARIDGMTEWSIAWRVMLPQIRPAVIAFAIFSIAGHWNDLLWPLIVVSQERQATPPLGMIYFLNETGVGADYGPLTAAATFVTLPIVAVFLIAQRHMTDGLTVSGRAEDLNQLRNRKR